MAAVSGMSWRRGRSGHYIRLAEVVLLLGLMNFPVAASATSSDVFSLASLDLDGDLAGMPFFDSIDDDAPPSPADMPISKIIRTVDEAPQVLVAQVFPEAELVAATVVETSLFPSLEERFWEFIAAAREKAHLAVSSRNGPQTFGILSKFEDIDIGQEMLRFVEAAKRQAKLKPHDVSGDRGLVSAR